MQKNEAEWKRFSAAIAILGDVCNEKVQKQKLLTYWKLLEDLSIDDFERACTTLANGKVQHFGHIPTPAEIREHAHGSMDDRAAQAWVLVQKALVYPGTYRGVDFNDKLINAALASIGGWVQLGRIKDEYADIKRKEFIEAYKSYLVNPPPAEMTKPQKGTEAGYKAITSSGEAVHMKALETADTAPPWSMTVPDEVKEKLGSIGIDFGAEKDKRDNRLDASAPTRNAGGKRLTKEELEAARAELAAARSA